MRPADHALLAATTRGTPMGTLLRRYWVAALLSRELAADGAPVRVRLLGEDLVAFRDSSGRVGLLREHCAHRGASLYYARNGESGLRCWYHGWKYDVEGNCLDQPNEANPFESRVKQPAYPCVERAGVVWAYMGPPEKKPELPDLEWMLVPESHVHVSKRLQLCHWTQGMEGDLDSSHIPFLHSGSLPSVASDPAAKEAVQWRSQDTRPHFDVTDTPAGIMQATRRNARPDSYYWRIGHWFFPGFTMLPAFSGDVPLTGHAWVPIDDGRCWVFSFSWHPKRPLREDELARMRTGSNIYPPLIPGTFVPLCNRDNEYAGPDAPPAPQPWMRITDLQAQDMAMTEGMGPLYDRTQENLGGSDFVIVHTRRRLIEAAQGLDEGREPPGMRASDYRYRGISLLLPREVTNWQDAIKEYMDPRPETFMESI
jgi:phenylpropionate dioxygenase-like ring-hydroxylating dioxygenase large terminal subunit